MSNTDTQATTAATNAYAADYVTASARAANRGSRYAVISAVFVGLLLISNITAVKLIAFGPFIVDGGVFLFPLVYVTGDVLAEVYGIRASRRAIFTAFGLSLLASLTIWLTQLSPAAQGWDNQQAFEEILGFVPRIVAASLGGFLAGQLMNAWVLVKMKARTSGRFLRTRLIASTAVGQIVDTAVFCVIAFFGVIEGWEFFGYVALGYFIKVMAEVVLLPVTTRAIAAIRRAEERGDAADRLSSQRR